MFAPHLYKTIYIAICFILIIVTMMSYASYPSGLLTRTPKPNITKAVIILSLFIVFFGLRPNDNDPKLYMADTSGYANYYNKIQDGFILVEDFRLSDSDGDLDKPKDFLFFDLMSSMAVADFPVEAFFLVIAALYLIPKMLLIRKWFGYNALLATLFVITTFGFYSGGINGIRNAVGSSLFALSMAYIVTEKFNWKSFCIGIVICYLAYNFHNSIIISLVALAGAYFVIKTTNSAIVVWIFAIVLALSFGNAIALFGAQFFDDDRATKYIEAGMDNEVMTGFAYTGFRWDFLLYSAMPILMGWYVTVKKGIKDKVYQILLNTYILANSVWVIFIYAAYNNRFAAISWALYSYVLLYPLVRYKIWGSQQSFFTGLILLGQLAFAYLF